MLKYASAPQILSFIKVCPMGNSLNWSFPFMKTHQQLKTDGEYRRWLIHSTYTSNNIMKQMDAEQKVHINNWCKQTNWSMSKQFIHGVCS